MKSLKNKGAILILSGPSGCGKSSLLKKLYEKIDNYYFSISTTTREPRVGEKNGVDYLFTDITSFEQDIENENFLEYAKVHNNYYGTSLKPILEALEEGKLVIFDIDVQGHELVREKLNNVTTSVFITTPSLKILDERLNSRGTDDKDVIEKRITNSKIEINSIDTYDYIIINDDIDLAAKNLESIANTALLKAQLFNKDELIKEWLEE